MKKDVLIGVQDKIEEAIEIGSYSVYMTDSKSDGNGYEIVRWESKPYTEQISDNDKDTSKNKGRIIYVTHCDKVKSSFKRFYLRDDKSTISLLHVLKGKLMLQLII